MKLPKSSTFLADSMGHLRADDCLRTRGAAGLSSQLVSTSHIPPAPGRRYVNRKTTSRVGVAESTHTERNVLVFLEELLDFFLRPIVECYFYVIQFYGDPSPIFILK